MANALFDSLHGDLRPDAQIDPTRPSAVIHRGRRQALALEVAVWPDGRVDCRVSRDEPALLRFVRRTQVARSAHQTGDVAFDAAVALLGEPEGLLTLGPIARAGVRRWLARPGAWCTTAAAGITGIAPTDAGACLDAAIALVDSFKEPALVDLVRERASLDPSIQVQIDARIEAEIADAAGLDEILAAMVEAPVEQRVRWLARARERLMYHRDLVLPLLPTPVPEVFDTLLLYWAQGDGSLLDRLAPAIAERRRCAALLNAAAEDAEALQMLATRLPRDAETSRAFARLSPKDAAARVIRLGVLAACPAGDPLAVRDDLNHAAPTVRRAAEGVLEAHLTTWLTDPGAAKTVFGPLGLGNRLGDLLIEQVEARPEPGLIEVLAEHRFSDPAREVRRLDTLATLPLTKPFEIAQLLEAPDRRVRAAARRVLDAHLTLWLTVNWAARALAPVVAGDLELSARILATCRQTACAGAVPLLTSIRVRTESERLEVIEALGRTGSPSAEHPLLTRMDAGYTLRLACIEALAHVGGKAALKALDGVSRGFLVERTLKETALRAIAAIEARLGGGAGGLSLSAGDGRLSLPERE